MKVIKNREGEFVSLRRQRDRTCRDRCREVAHYKVVDGCSRYTSRTSEGQGRRRALTWTRLLSRSSLRSRNGQVPGSEGGQNREEEIDRSQDKGGLLLRIRTRRPAASRDPCESAKLLKTYQMPIVAKPSRRGRRQRQGGESLRRSRRDDQTKDICGRSAACRRAFRGTASGRDGRESEINGV